METTSDFVLRALKNRIAQIIERDQGLADSCATDSQLAHWASVRTAKEILEFIELLEKK